MTLRSLIKLDSSWKFHFECAHVSLDPINTSQMLNVIAMGSSVEINEVT